MSVMGSQLEIDMDPDGDLTVVPRHQGQTGTGCYKLHDHRLRSQPYQQYSAANSNPDDPPELPHLLDMPNNPSGMLKGLNSPGPRTMVSINLRTYFIIFMIHHT